jgi:FAD/FMN-containing dehydrogenase
MSASTPLIAQLRSIVGATNVLTHEDPATDLSAWELDWRKREQGRALAVVRPASTAEVAAVVKACVAAGTPIVPQGGNTGMVVGSTPDASGTQVVLSLTRMNRVRALDGANLTITVDAGCVLQTLQETCEQAGFLFPLSLASEGSCTIGGNLGSNAGGTQVVRYGNTRELCLGLEVVTAQGEVWDGLTGLRKDNTGYDLRHLFIGSEGTLGVITGATMKVYPLPKAQLTAFAALPSLDAAVELLGLAHQHLSAGLTGFEVMGKFALSLVTKHFAQIKVPFQDLAEAPYFVVLENSDQESEAHARERFEHLLEAAMEAGCVLDAVVAESITQARALWHIRESIPLAQAQEGLNIKHDISIAVSRIPEFVRETDALLQAAYPGARLVNYGHLGDGNLHYNVQAPVGADAEAFLRDDEKGVNAIVYGQVDTYRGSISAEHGIGSLKRDKLVDHKSPVALGMMRAIKRALDPDNRMNPGKMLAP